jgi:hypothetical protein
MLMPRPFISPAVAHPLASGRIEQGVGALKWLALLFMVLDHVNVYLFQGRYSWMYVLGRISMPLFAYVFGFNLARVNAGYSAVYLRTAKRLLIFGTLAIWPSIALNIMFTFLVTAFVVWLLLNGGKWATSLAACAAFFGGAMVEYWWPAVGAGVCAWAYFRFKSVYAIAAYIACIGMFYLANDDFWALLVLPVVGASCFFRWTLPRAKLFFYAFYPLHLALILLVRQWL